MTIVLGLALALFALLVFVGRRPARLSAGARLARALFAALAAVGAVVSALRGGWMASLVLVLLSAVLARAARIREPPPPPPGGPGHDGQGQRGFAPVASGMSVAEARSILGVSETAGRAEIVSAYRRLMIVAHPDHGGSTGLAAQLNAARDRLLATVA
jgi:hypothetical protein